MNSNVKLAFASACLLLSLSVRAQFQVVHDLPNTTTTPQLTPVLLADGSTVTHQWSAGEHLFRKYDGSGVLVWSKVLAGNAMDTWFSGAALTLVSDEADGFIFAVQDSVRIYVGIGPFTEDSLVYSYRIVRVNGNGDLTSAVLLKKSYAEQWAGSGDMHRGFDAARTPDNGVVVSMNTSNAGTGSIDLVKVNVNGTLAWCRSVGQPIGQVTGPEPTWALNQSASATVAVSSTGRIYYSEGGNYPYNHLRLGALDTDGSLLWMKRYVYGNTSPMVQYHDIAVDADGDVHGAGSLSTTVGHFHIFLRTNADGVLERGDIYRTSYNLNMGHFGLDGQGRRYHRLPFWYTGGVGGSHGILIADTLGTPARFVRRNDQVVLPNNVFTIPQRFDVTGDQLAVSNLLHHEDVDLAYTTRYEGLSVFTTDDIDPCLMDDTTFAHIPVPLNPVMTTEEITTAVSVDVSAYYSIEPIALTLTTPDDEELVLLCEFVGELLGLNTGVNGTLAGETLPLIRNTLLARGTPIALNGTAMVTVEVYDSSGALTQRSLLNEERSLSTTTWSPGMYVIRAIDRNGSPLGIGRVVVE